MRHGVEATERDIAWLDELIAAEHEAELGETGPPEILREQPHDPSAQQPDTRPQLHPASQTPDADPDEDRSSLQSQ